MQMWTLINMGEYKAVFIFRSELCESVTRDVEMPPCVIDSSLVRTAAAQFNESIVIIGRYDGHEISMTTNASDVLQTI